LETNIQGAKRLLVNVTAGPDFSIGEAHEAMEYILQFTDAEDAEIIMGHVMKETLEGEVQITLLAAGMDLSNRTVSSKIDPMVFVQPTIPAEYSRQRINSEPFLPDTTSVPVSSVSNEGTQTQLAAPQLEDIDLDIPTFLRRQRLGE
jgi:cell division protein FtsZ